MVDKVDTLHLEIEGELIETRKFFGQAYMHRNIAELKYRYFLNEGYEGYMYVKRSSKANSFSEMEETSDVTKIKNKLKKAV